HDRLTEKAHGNVAINIIASKDRSGLNGPPSDLKIFGSYSAISGVPVLSSVDHLHSSIDIRTHAFETGNFCEDDPRVFARQTLCLSCPIPHAIRRTAAGLDPNHVVSELLELAFHLCRSSLAHSNDADKRSNSDDQTEDGENRPDQIAPQ